MHNFQYIENSSNMLKIKHKYYVVFMGWTHNTDAYIYTKNEINAIKLT